jgi:hypothetical protein
MNKIRMNKNIALVILLATLSACVTINIYFPAAAAEKAADKIIEEVWQLEEGKNKPTETPETTSEAKPADAPAK